eukprot:2142322-Pyramimonas_sp.AAC.1
MGWLRAPWVDGLEDEQQRQVVGEPSEHKAEEGEHPPGVIECVHRRLSQGREFSPQGVFRAAPTRSRKPRTPSPAPRQEI